MAEKIRFFKQAKVKSPSEDEFEVDQNIKVLIIAKDQNLAEQVEKQLLANGSLAEEMSQYINNQTDDELWSHFSIHKIQSGLEGLMLCKEKNYHLILCAYDTLYLQGWEFIKQFKNHDEIINMPIALFHSDRKQIEMDLANKKKTMQEYGIVSLLAFPDNNKSYEQDIRKTLRAYLDPQSLEFAYTEAKKELLQDHLEESKKIYHEINDQHQETSRSNLGLSSVYKKEGIVEKQKEYLSKAFSLDKENLSIMYERFLLAVNAKDQKEQQKITDSYFKEKEARNSVVLYRLAQILFEAAQYSQAIKLMAQFQKFLVGTPHFLYIIWSKCFIKLKKIDEAFKIISGLKDDCKKDWQVLNMMGIIYRNQKEFQKSLDAFFAALKQNPTDHRILFNIALAFGHLQDYEQSKIYAQRVLKLAPQFHKAETYLQKLAQKNEK